MFYIHNFCQLSKENYFDDDGILDGLIENECRARQRRSQNHNANPNSEKNRNNMKMYIDKNFQYMSNINLQETVRFVYNTIKSKSSLEENVIWKVLSLIV